jgi:hypothetical protein
MNSYVTSYNGLFNRPTGGTPAVQRIEIPIIQRDYAQGREGGTVARIRANFLNVLHDALTKMKPISLDFVYGDVIDGTLRPLDGQQRLTTLFLLHWYLAWRSGKLEQESGWKRFEYATRPSARCFCECLVASEPPIDARLRPWFEDQPWFLHTWRHDPTIQSMIVMLEAIHERFSDADCVAAWKRLVDADAPAISFHLLPIEQMGLSEDLYIKMNSRGKPLTNFENFKARFEQVLEHSCPDRVEGFAKKIDGDWADLLWPFRGNDDSVDDKFLRYLQFITDICAWSDGLPADDVGDMAMRVYGTENKNAEQHLDFLIRSFDTWLDTDIDAVFSATFSLAPSKPDSDETSNVVLFDAPGSSVNLFTECCSSEVRRGNPLTLLLYAVLLHRLHGTSDFPRRVRLLRNLIEASSNEIRADRMSTLISDVRHLIVTGKLDGIEAFNQAQVADEKLKAEMLAKAPSLKHCLFHLEDHPLLRGCLAAFDLDVTTFEPRARAFHELFTEANLLPLTGALLAAGDYSLRTNHRFVQLGSSVAGVQWRDEILTGSSRAHLAGVRLALGRLLDVIAAHKGDVQSALATFTQDWLDNVDYTNGLDWRWYFVRYPEMRAGSSGRYASETGTPGYSMCMLDKKGMNSYYRDPYLAAIRQLSGVSKTVVQGSVPHNSGEPGFTGYETAPRWMHLVNSQIGMRMVPDGIELRAPTAALYEEAFSRICSQHGIGADLCLRVPQVIVDGCLLDTKDRVRLGAELLRDLVKSGL